MNPSLENNLTKAALWEASMRATGADKHELLRALVALADECNGKLGANPYSVPAFQAACIAAGHAIGYPVNKISWYDALDRARVFLKQNPPPIPEHTIVQLTSDLEPMPKGTQGTVVHIYPGGGYEVEFMYNFETVVLTVQGDWIERRSK